MAKRTQEAEGGGILHPGVDVESVQFASGGVVPAACTPCFYCSNYCAPQFPPSTPPPGDDG